VTARLAGLGATSISKAKITITTTISAVQAASKLMAAVPSSVVLAG
jgi:hypothetical protein